MCVKSPVGQGAQGQGFFIGANSAVAADLTIVPRRLNKPEGLTPASKRSTDHHNSYCGPSWWALHRDRNNLTRRGKSVARTRKKKKKKNTTERGYLG